MSVNRETNKLQGAKDITRFLHEPVYLTLADPIILNGTQKSQPVQLARISS